MNTQKLVFFIVFAAHPELWILCYPRDQQHHHPLFHKICYYLVRKNHTHTNKPKLKESSQTVSQTKKRSTTPSDDIVTPNAKKKKSEKPEANATPKPITVIPEIFKNQIYVKKDGFTKEKDTNNEEIHLAVPSEEKQNSISLVNSKTSGLTSQVEGKVKNSKAHKSSTLDFLGQSSSIQKHHVVEDYKKYKQISTE